MYIGGAAGEHRVKKEFSSAQVNGFSRDLFVDRFTNGNNFHNNNRREEEEDDDVEVELSLGLSLNGKFGVDPAKDRVKLIRSSSVSTLFILGGDEETHASNKVPILPAAYAPLSRTCSLPTETGEVLRKRKELQSLRRMEAKRRRMDKIKFLRAGREKVDSEDYSGEENPSNGCGNSSGMVSSVNGSTGMPSSQGSIGSQGSWSSGLAEFESQPIQVVNRNNEVRRPSTMQYVQVQNDQKPQVSRPGSAAVAKAATESKEMLKNVMLEMPCVSTIGNGPNGRKIDGFLYTYRKGEEVKIVCVCHGNFMSPAEFVKHAGGAEVDNPLRHISVNNPSPVL